MQSAIYADYGAADICRAYSALGVPSLGGAGQDSLRAYPKNCRKVVWRPQGGWLGLYGNGYHDSSTSPPRPQRAGPAAKPNPTPGGYPVSAALWAVRAPLVPVHVTPHRCGGGWPLGGAGRWGGRAGHAPMRGQASPGVGGAGTGRCPRPPWAGDNTGANPTACGTRGVTQRRLTDAQGMPGGLALEGAHRHDMTRVWATMDSWPAPRPAPHPDPPQGMCLDQGDDCAAVRRTRAECGCSAHIRRRGAAVQASTQRRHARPAAGGWNARTEGGTAAGASGSVGTKTRNTASPFFISPALSSPSEPPGYWDRL